MYRNRSRVIYKSIGAVVSVFCRIQLQSAESIAGQSAAVQCIKECGASYSAVHRIVQCIVKCGVL